MKKLIGISGAALAAVFIFAAYNNKLPKVVAAEKIYKTLNGVNQSTATTRIRYFKNSFDRNTSNPKVSWDKGPKSFYAFFDRDQIGKMIALLKTETKYDGIRIYLGSENNPARYDDHVRLHLFIVSTYKRNPHLTEGPGVTNHLDYYDHDKTSYLGTSIQFKGDHHNDAAYGPGDGALLYDKPEITSRLFPRTDCPPTGDTRIDPHHIRNLDALNWVQKRGHKATQIIDSTGYNTISEWFSKNFINHLFGIIATPANNLSGLRIYYGKGLPDVSSDGPNGDERDRFILIPTRKSGSVDKDFYDCIDGFPNPFYKLSVTKSGSLEPFNNGELCPTHCP